MGQFVVVKGMTGLFGVAQALKSQMALLMDGARSPGFEAGLQFRNSQIKPRCGGFKRALGLPIRDIWRGLGGHVEIAVRLL